MHVNHSVGRSLAACVVVLVFSSATLGKVIYVDDDATGANDGTSWADAYIYLQDALADANDSPKPVEIHVAQGICRPDQGTGQALDDRKATFRLIDDVTLKGGYAGLGGPDPNARDVRAHITILSGEIGKGRFATAEDNSYHILSAPYSDGAVDLNGFTISGGNASGSGLFSGGGGLINHGSRVTVADCIFTENRARLGGGLYNRDGSVILLDCCFSANMAFQWGGGICNDNGALEVAHCVFADNLGGFGGGVCDGDGTVALTNCTFSGNSGLQGGGVHYLKAIYTDPRRFRVTRRFIIRNDTARLDRITLWLPMAMECDSQRDVLAQEVLPAALGVSHQPQYGSGVRFWDIQGGPERGQSLYIVEQFTYTCYAVCHYVDPTQIGAYEADDPVTEVYTRAGKFVEASAPGIVETATQIAGSETNPYWIAYSVYRWVIDHMTYRSVQGLKGANFAFDRGYGECGDYSALFVALCRAVGIPARPVVGRWAVSSPGGWHVWAEFYLPGWGWIPVDATRADDTGRPQDHFGQLSNNRLILNKTFDVFLDYSPNFFSPDVGFLQTYFWEYYGSSGKVHAEIEYDVETIKSGREAPAAGNHLLMPVVTNCIVWDNDPSQIHTAADRLRITYTDIQGGWPGEGNIDVDPLFCDPDSGDFHLKSQAGRWDRNGGVWVTDNVTSPCIDRGDPMSPVADEPEPNGGFINMGAYGGTGQASKSP